MSYQKQLVIQSAHKRGKEPPLNHEPVKFWLPRNGAPMESKETHRGVGHSIERFMQQTGVDTLIQDCLPRTVQDLGVGVPQAELAALLKIHYQTP